jgi:hypothetical protein
MGASRRDLVVAGDLDLFAASRFGCVGCDDAAETLCSAQLTFAISMLVIAAQQIPDNIQTLWLSKYDTLSAASRCWAFLAGPLVWSRRYL